MNYKIKISNSLGMQLKEFRVQHHIKNKDIASYIGKSPAYISKLEKGQIKQINRDELIKITNYISGTDDGYYQFCEEVASSSNTEELDQNTFLLNFDLIERQIPVNDEMIQDLKSRIESLDISIDDLTKYINQNEDLDNDFFHSHHIDPDSTEKNTWIPYTEADTNEVSRSFIILDFEKEKIEKLINGSLHKCEYMLPYAILYHLLKLTYKREGKTLDNKLSKQCQTEAEKILANDKFYSLKIQSQLRSMAQTQEEYENLLSSFDTNNINYINQILDDIQILSSIDVEYTNEKLKIIVDNFKGCDPSLVLAYMAIPLSDVENLQTSLKRDFLNEIYELTKKYSSIIDTQKNIEKY